MAFSVIVGFIFLLSYSSTQKNHRRLNKIFEEKYSSVVFEGNIRKMFFVKHYGRKHCILCVDITKANVTSYYQFDELMGLKIDSGKAVVPVDVDIVPEYINKFSYIKVNENYNKKIIFSNDNGNTDTMSLSYYHGGIDESNMNICECN